MKIKTSALDAMFSKIIRAERPICEVCKCRTATQVHHYLGRRKKSVRYDENNIISCCFACHRVFHEDVERGRAWMVAKIGENAYNALILRGNTPSKPDYSLLKIYFKQRMKELGI